MEYVVCLMEKYRRYEKLYDNLLRISSNRKFVSIFNDVLQMVDKIFLKVIPPLLPNKTILYLKYIILKNIQKKVNEIQRHIKEDLKNYISR